MLSKWATCLWAGSLSTIERRNLCCSYSFASMAPDVAWHRGDLIAISIVLTAKSYVVSSFIFNIDYFLISDWWIKSNCLLEGSIWADKEHARLWCSRRSGRMRFAKVWYLYVRLLTSVDIQTYSGMFRGLTFKCMSCLWNIYDFSIFSCSMLIFCLVIPFFLSVFSIGSSY